MVNFKLGDKVRLKPTLEEELGSRFRNTIGTVVGIQDYTSKQYCRVSFSDSIFDYDDFGAWRLWLVE